jgi:hypothetical protein
MKKLKCWKKTRDDKYARVHLHKSGRVGVSVESPLKALKVEDGYTVYYGDVTGASSRGFKSKNQASNFANKYMKKHNKCS